MLPIRLKIDSSFLGSEKRDGFLIPAEMKKVWAVELDLLNEFSQVCQKYGLKWFAHAGTMLGAVRHHGFIPWDNDIDIVMPRDDYERLCEIGPSVFPHPYFFQNEDTDRFFARAFSRLRNAETTAIFMTEMEYAFPYNQGIFIDIFPLDHLPSDTEERKLFYIEISNLNAHAIQWRNLIHFYRPKKNVGFTKRTSYWLKHLLYKYIFRSDYRHFMDKHHALITSYNNKNTGWVGESIIPTLGRQLWRTEWVSETIFMPFEMLQVPVPVHYEECLSASFGQDWRIPKNIPTLHGETLFDTEKPYTSYLTHN